MSRLERADRGNLPPVTQPKLPYASCRLALILSLFALKYQLSAGSIPQRQLLLPVLDDVAFP